MVPAGQGHRKVSVWGLGPRRRPTGSGHGVVYGASLLKPDTASEGGRRDWLDPNTLLGSPQTMVLRGGLTTTKTAPLPQNLQSPSVQSSHRTLQNTEVNKQLTLVSRMQATVSSADSRLLELSPSFCCTPSGGHSPSLPPVALSLCARCGQRSLWPHSCGGPMQGGVHRASCLHNVLAAEPRSPPPQAAT